MWKRDEEVAPEYKEGESYTNREKELMADKWLRDDARSEVCRECGGKGAATGAVQSYQQFAENGDPLEDAHGGYLFLEFPEYSCPKSHQWFQGEGEARGIGGDNPILFEEHLHSRRRREIFPANGT